MPVMVRFWPTLPASKEIGETCEIDGTGVLTLSETGVEFPPPGEGFTIEICTAPGLTTSAGVSWTVRDVGLLKVVPRLAPFTNAVDSVTKFFPVTLSKTPLGLPATVLLGLIEVTWGMPLLVGVIVNIVKAGGGRFVGGKVPPPG